MVIEAQSQKSQQSTNLINTSSTNILNSESTLNLGEYPSAFNRVVGRGINSTTIKVSENVTNNQQLDNSSSSSSTNPTPIEILQQSSTPQGSTQQHRLLLTLIQNQIKGAASGSSNSTTVAVNNETQQKQQLYLRKENNICKIQKEEENSSLLKSTNCKISSTFLQLQKQQRGMHAPTSGSNVVGNANVSTSLQQSISGSDRPSSPLEAKMELSQLTSNFPNSRFPQASTESTGNGNNLQMHQTQQSSSHSITEGTGPCGGCVELRREVDELRQMLFQMQNESSAFSPSSATRCRQQQSQNIQKPHSPPSPPHPSIPQPVLQQTFQSSNNQQLRQALLLQNQATINSNTQGQVQQQFLHSGNANNYNSHVLQLFLSQASANQQQQIQHSQNLSHPPVPISSTSSTSTTPATVSSVNRILEQLGQQLDISTQQSSSGNNTQTNAQQILSGVGTEKQQQQLLVSTIQMLHQAAQIQQINGQASQQHGSGASTRNNSIQSGESVFFDPTNGMDVSETSSSASSTNAQIMLQTSPQILLDSKPAALLQQLQQHQTQIVNVNQMQQQQQHQQNQQNFSNRNNQLDLINAAISRTNAAVTSHLLSPHGAESNVIQQQQQCNTTLSNTPMAAKLATLQTLLLSLQQQQQQQLAIQQRMQQQAQIISAPKSQQQHQFVAPNRMVVMQQQQSPTRSDNIHLTVSSVASQQHQQQQQNHFSSRIGNQHQHILRNNPVTSVPVPSSFNRNLPPNPHHQQQQQRHHDSNNHHQLLQHHPSAQNERVVVERRRAASDDYIQSICSQKYTDEHIQQIQIPVPEAHTCDPNFRPLTEQQVIQQVLQNKKYENQSVAETMAQLCKKLAEKRVFGSRLMSKTTVAAPNHSSYSNLPLPGIIYIYHVCQKVLFKRVDKEEEFKECFRDAMRKLAARCRRVRHARKNHNFKHHGAAVSSGGLDSPSMLLVNQPTSAFSQFNSGISKNNNTNNADDNVCDAATINAALLAELANRQQQQQMQHHQKFSLHSALGNFEITLAAAELASRVSEVNAGNDCNRSPLDNSVCIASQQSNVEKMEISEDTTIPPPTNSHCLSADRVERELEEELLDEDLNCCPLSSPTISSQSTGEASTTHQQSPGDADRDSIENNEQQIEIPTKNNILINIKQQLSPINNQKTNKNASNTTNILTSQPMDASSSSPCF